MIVSLSDICIQFHMKPELEQQNSTYCTMALCWTSSHHQWSRLISGGSQRGVLVDIQANFLDIVYFSRWTNKSVGWVGRPTDKNREWKIEHCLGHLLDLRCCDLVWLQLIPGGGFPVNLWSLSRCCLSDLYLPLRPMGNGDDFHDNGLDSMLFLAGSSPSSA